MHNKDLKRFLEGELKPSQLDFEKNSIENEFAQSYQNLIEESKVELPDFDPLKKVKTEEKKRITLVKRFLPYAASLLLLLSLFLFHQHNNRHKLALSKNELQEIQHNTTMALMHFSKELNACMAKFEASSSIPETSNEFKLEKNNPFKNFKIN